MRSNLLFTILVSVLAITVYAQKTWTGSTSTAWNVSTNWNPSGAPAASDNVTIPSSPANQPLISGITNAVCKNLTVDSGATLSIKGTSSSSSLLTVSGTATFNGALSIGGYGIFPSITGKLAALNVVWNSTSSIEPLYGARCEVSGNWTFSSGSSVNLGLCSLTFTGASGSNIYNHSNASSFNSLTLSKTGGASVYINAASSATMNINGTLNIGSGSVFNGASSITTVLKGNLVNSGNIYLNSGTLNLEKASGTQDIQINTNDYFNSVVINTGGTVTLSTTYLMQLRGSMNIQTGVLDPQNNTIALFGDWSNTAGPDAFVQGTGRVIFNGGNYHQYCSDETFSTLEVNKSAGGALRVNGTDVTCSKYDWTAGAIDVLNNGTFTVSSQLTDNGIAGNFYLNSGCTINLTNLTGNIDLKGNLYIYGGNFNVYGGVNPSWWPAGGNASITMTGGILDFIDQGMLIRPDATYSFNYNITGGTIRTAGNFASTRSDFNPTAGTIELYGPDACYLIPSAGSLYNVEIDKTSGTIVDVTSDATINGSLTVNSGTMKVNNQVLTTSENIMVNNGGTLWMDQNSQLKIGTSKTLNVFSGGTLRTEGTPGNEVVVTRNGASGNYVINITSGATIAAQRASFYYVDPLRVHAGATIENTYPFYYCKFRYATFGMLRIDNDQDLLLRNVEFLGPATGYNVYKSVDSGHLEFKDSFGDYSGATYENDPYNRIDWTVTQPGLWTGVVSTSWYTGGNWDDGLVPNAATNVVIPASAPNMPAMDAGVWECNNLDIEGTLTISGANLTANGNMTVTGTLAMTSAADILSVLGDVVWESGSQASITADAAIEVYGHWNFNSGSNAQLNNGKVYFEGTTNKWIRNYSSTSRFNDVYVTKTSGAQISFSDLSTEDLIINGDLLIFANGKFVSDGGRDVILSGDLISDGICQFTTAALKLDGIDQSIKPNTNDYFNHLVFSQTGTVTINTANTSILDVNGNLHIDSGVFDAGSCTILVGGNWDNSQGPAAFTEGGSRVIFNGGNYHQYCPFDESFSILEINKSAGGAFRVNNGADVSCAEYDWTAGAVDVLSGSFTAPSLTDNGIKGNFYVNTGGTITLGQYGSNPQLIGNLFINGGSLNIIAAIESQWPGDGNASITMTDGELNVYPYGIEIVDNPPYTFTTNITGGSIRTEGSFINYRADFNPTGGKLELHGTQDAGLQTNGGSLFGLTVNKSAGKSVILSNDATVTGPLYVNSGTLLADGNVLTTAQNVVVQSGGILWIDENSQLKIGTSQALTVFSGSTLRVEGSPGNEAVVTRNGASGNYVINITSGATIAAQRASFYYVDPLRVHAGATIENTNPFHYCKFRYATFGMLRIDNDQDLLLRNVELLGPATGYNVYKSVDQGNLEFKDAYGDYSGATYENDPYNRIDWTVTQPGLWTGAVSTNWYTGDNWDDGNVPNAGTNVVIPASAPNMPVMDAGVWECNNLDIEGTLTISGANLTANGNMTVTGTLAMTSAADILSVLGDVVWESGSQASITADAAIEVYGHWNFNSGSDADLNNGKVYFEGTTDKWIRIFSENVRFNDIYVTKTSGAQIGFSDLSTENLFINGDLRVFANGKFVSDGGVDVILKGDLISDGTTQCNAGRLILNGSDQSIKPNTNDYFNYLYFGQTGTATINTSNTSMLNVKDGLAIHNGIFDPSNCTIKNGGDWSNWVGTDAFIEGSSRIIFNGDNNYQYCWTDETFYTLEVDKPLGGALRTSNSPVGNTVFCSEYDWTAGALDAVNGNFTATSLLDNGIAGDFYVTDGGSITLGNLSGIPHLKGNLHIYGGTFNIIAPIGSEWGGHGDASITMTDGELNVYPYGIEIIDNPSYSFTSNITGGTIRTEGAFINYRDDFNPTGGTLELHGTQDAGLLMSGGSLHGLTVDKSAGKSATIASDVTVNGPLTVKSGTLLANGHVLTTADNVAVQTGGTLWMDENSQLKIGSSQALTVFSGSTLRVEGGPGNETVVTRNGASGNYVINISDGATIAAQRASFYYVDPLRVHAGATIEDTYPFYYCKFRYATFGMLRIDNDQDLLLRNVEFLGPATGYNVYKSVDSGHLEFKDSFGDYSGATYENDPYNRIDWTVTQPGLWTGTVSTNWYTGDNWDDGNVPNAGTNVVIPTSAPNMPVMDAGVWECNNLDIEGTLTISGANLTANGNMTVTGTLAMTTAADILSVLGDVVWESGSQASITADAAIEVYGHWNFNSGSNAQLNDGKVYFEGTTDKWIRNYSATSSFNHIYVTKTSGAQIGFNDLSTEPLLINGDLRVFANGKFVSDGWMDVILSGDLISDGITQCNAGYLYLQGTDQVIKPNTNDYFNHLYFYQTGTVTINTTNTSILNVKGRVYISSGVFNAGDCIIKVGGGWSNHVGTDGFIEGTSRVIFNGDNNDQNCHTDETFYTLEVDKPLGGALKLNNGPSGKTVVCTEYDWTAGALDAVNGNFTATSLLDNGIAGDFYVEDGGSITLGNMSGSPHLKGNIHVDGGTFNIIAPIGSEWGGHGDASITMTDGELNVYPYGIEIIDNPSYNFTSNITGGTIRTEGAFINNRTDFNPTGGTLELYGSGDAGLLMSDGSLHGLTVDKSAGKSVTIASDVTVNGPLYVNSGTLLANGHVLTTAENIAVQTGGTLWMDENSQLKIGSSQELTVFSGSTLRVEGSPGNEVVVTRNGASGNYVININSGATIAAQHASFYYVDPLRVHAGATIENTNPFNFCKFRYATFGMLRVDNDQDLLLQNVEFLGPATGYNVYKSMDSGILEFKDYYGDYSGAAYEYDPYNRINWTNNAFSLDVKVYLEGPFNGGQMATTLNPAVLPLAQPYNQAPWNYSGSESVAAIPGGSVVDWILIELRDAPDAASATGATLLARRAGFLHSNGTVTGTDGISLMEFTETVTNNLFVVVRHRNHISIMSGNHLQANAGIYTWDFSSGVNQVYGGGNAHKQIASGIWGMTGADGNADGQINNGDKNDVWVLQAGTGGYKPGDFNLDAQVNNGDKNDVWVPNTGMGGQVPENGGYKCHVPE